MHLPARFADDQPYLASLALSLAADALERAGDPAAASRLRAHLEAHDPSAAMALVDASSPNTQPAATQDASPGARP